MGVRLGMDMDMDIDIVSMGMRMGMGMGMGMDIDMAVGSGSTNLCLRMSRLTMGGGWWVIRGLRSEARDWKRIGEIRRRLDMTLNGVFGMMKFGIQVLPSSGKKWWDSEWDLEVLAT